MSQQIDEQKTEPLGEDSSDAEIEKPDIEKPDIEGQEQAGVKTTEENAEPDFDDDVIITIGDETQQQEQNQAPDWVRDLRKAHRKTQRENRELKEKLQALERPETQPVGLKPDLEKLDYDTEKYEQELTAWYERKHRADEKIAQQQLEEEKQRQTWQEKLDTYTKAKSELKVKDFDDAESVILEMLDQTQQGIVVQGADNPALVIYALGKNPERAKELSSIRDPVKFAFSVAKLEKDLKVTNRKAPPPEKSVNGTGRKSDSISSTLERLREEARKTGDFTKVTAYRRKQQAKLQGNQ